MPTRRLRKLEPQSSPLLVDIACVLFRRAETAVVELVWMLLK